MAESDPISKIQEEPLQNNLENSPVIAVSPRASAILSEINFIDSAIRASEIKITCPVLGAGPHDVENYKKRVLVKDKIEKLGHNGFFPEEISKEDAKKFLMDRGIEEHVANIITSTDEAKNDALLDCCTCIFAVAGTDGVLLETGKCCRTKNESKLRVIVENDKYHKLSQPSQTLNEIKNIHGNVFGYDDENEIPKIVEDIIALECRKIIRITKK